MVGDGVNDALAFQASLGLEGMLDPAIYDGSGVAMALAVFSAARYFTVIWLGEHVTADVRQRVYAHVIQQSPAFQALPGSE